jgi:hypothetical protein
MRMFSTGLSSRLVGGAFAVALVAGSTLAAAPAVAAELRGTIVGGSGVVDTFDIASTGGIKSNAEEIRFAITNDALGGAIADFGDYTTGFCDATMVCTPNGDGILLILDSSDNELLLESLVPAIYDGSSDATFTLTPGVYPGDVNGTTLTLSAAPEPGAWTLMILGVGLAGACLRRRRASQLFAA